MSLMAKLKVSVAFTSYQSGLFYLLGSTLNGGLNVHQSAIMKPMGLAVSLDEDKKRAREIHLTSNHQILRFVNALSEGQLANKSFDACFVPREVRTTGRLDAHDIGIDGEGEQVFVNTRFNCLAKLAEQHSFTHIWKPKFISEIVDEDRCHLNGLAMVEGKPKFATAISQSNTIDGWRDRRANGGVVIEIESGAVVCKGLSMPHSPRWHLDRLWVLNSGTGEIGAIDLDVDDPQERFVPKAFCPGFVRGLGFAENYAFVGLSKPRYERFTGLELDQRLQDADAEPWCGIQVIELSTGRCVEWFRIDGEIGELYDVAVVPGIACPMAVSPSSEEAASFVTFEQTS